MTSSGLLCDLPHVCVIMQGLRSVLIGNLVLSGVIRKDKPVKRSRYFKEMRLIDTNGSRRSSRRTQIKGAPQKTEQTTLLHSPPGQRPGIISSRIRQISSAQVISSPIWWRSPPVRVQKRKHVTWLITREMSSVRFRVRLCSSDSLWLAKLAQRALCVLIKQSLVSSTRSLGCSRWTPIDFLLLHITPAYTAICILTTL